MVGKSSDTKSRVKEGLSRYTPQKRLLVSESSLSLKEIRYSEQEFPADKLISNIQYHYLSSQNNNLFYLFNDQVDYALFTYFIRSETIKSNVNRFLTNRLIVFFTKKSFYWNADKWMEKLFDISWGIPNDKWIDHKFEYQSVLDKIARREIWIYL